MKKIVFLPSIMLLLVLGGCATISWQGVCRHEAIYAAIVVRDDVGEKNVRIAEGPSGPTTTHAQAQVFINGEWQWLHAQVDQVYLSTQDRFTPVRYLTIEVFEAQQKILATPEYRKFVESRTTLKNKAK